MLTRAGRVRYGRARARRVSVALLAGLAGGVLAGALLARFDRPPDPAGRRGRRPAVRRRPSVRAAPVRPPAEVAELAEALNGLAAALTTSEGRERDFLLSVSHELRTPLTTIKGYAEALADGVVGADGAAEAGATMLAEAERLDRLIADLLVLARLEAADLPLDIVPVDLVELMRAAGRGVGARAARRTGPRLPRRAAARYRWWWTPTRAGSVRSSTGCGERAADRAARGAAGPRGPRRPGTAASSRSATAVPASPTTTSRWRSSGVRSTSGTGASQGGQRAGLWPLAARLVRRLGGKSRRATRRRAAPASPSGSPPILTRPEHRPDLAPIVPGKLGAPRTRGRVMPHWDIAAGATALLAAVTLGVAGCGSARWPADRPGCRSRRRRPPRWGSRVRRWPHGLRPDDLDCSPPAAPAAGDVRVRPQLWPGRRARVRTRRRSGAAPPGPGAAGPQRLHGEAVVKTKDGGTKTVAVQRGEVTAIDGDSVTVKSTDGFTLTWTFGDELRVVERRTTVRPTTSRWARGSTSPGPRRATTASPG